MQLNSCGAVSDGVLTAVSKQHVVTECLHAIGLITNELLMNLRNFYPRLQQDEEYVRMYTCIMMI